MKILIAGAGAMGCRIGSMLYEAGQTIELVDEWQIHLDAIRTHGLNISNEQGEKALPIRASLPEEVHGDFDLIIFLPKAMDTERMVRKCRHLISSSTKVLTLQNGLGIIDTLEKMIAREKIYAGTTTFASGLIGPGRIETLGSGETEVMQVDHECSGSLKSAVDVLNQAGMNVSLTNDVMKTVWKKAVFNSILNPLCTMLKTPVASLGVYSKADQLIDQLVYEVIPVARAEGVSLDGEEVKGMIIGAFDPALSGTHLPSMYQDIQNGRKTEIDYLNGAIVKKAKIHGIEVPTHAFICHLIYMLEESVGIKQ